MSAETISTVPLATPSETKQSLPPAGVLAQLAVVSQAPETEQHLSYAATDSAQDTSNVVKELACYATLLVAGWSDASAGPLIPHIQRYYGLSYTAVSMLFVGQAVGFLLAGAANVDLSNRFGLVH